MGLFNPRILDASIRDIVVNLSDIQKADVLLQAFQHLPIQGCRVVVENAVQSLLQVPNLPSTKIASALLLRAKRRLAAGFCTSAQKDLQSALMVDPENQDVKAMIRSQNIPPEMPIREPDCPPRFSEDIWWQIALFLPKSDLKSLLFVPNTPSRIASQLLFREIKLHLTIAIEPPGGEGDHPQTVSWKFDARNDQRNADILTQILVNPSFASQVRNLSIFAFSNDGTPPLAFKMGMLISALPKLLNIREVHCSGNKELVSRLLQVAHSCNPRLRRLSLVVADDATDIEVPVFQHLTHFAISSHGGNASSVRIFLARSRDNLRYLSIRNPSWNFSPTAISVRHLTQIEFNGCLSTDAFSQILENGDQLESLMFSGTLKCIASSLFRRHRTALPFLRHFSLTITGVSRQTTDRGFCYAISDFVRERTQLRTYHLFIPSTVASRVGFDASAWGVLPGLTKLSSLSITFPEDLPPSLAGWLVPRTVRALTLSLWPAIDANSIAFMNQLHWGMPPLLRYVGINNTSIYSAHSVVEQGFPNVRVVGVGETFWTVTRSREDGEREVEEWPCRTAKHHAAERLESLGCADAIWKGWTASDIRE